jgi:predicted nucleotidyltransferase
MISSEIKPYLSRACRILNTHRVAYLVVGGAAVSYYGFNRPSGIGQFRSEFKVDLDFWYKPTLWNFNKIINALKELNVDTKELEDLIFDPKRTFLKIPLGDFHIDFLPTMDGLGTFKESDKTAQTFVIGGVLVRVISLDDLIKNKRAVDRLADKSDIKELDRIRKNKGRKRGI